MRKIIIVLTLSILSLMTTACQSFQREPLLPEFENTYFKYAVETKQDGTKVGYLTGFTELGKTQTTLVLPSEIDGIQIVGIGYRRKLPVFGDEVISQFESEQLEKLFIPFDQTSEWRWQYDFGLLPNCYIITWTDSSLVRMGLVKGYIYTYYAAKNDTLGLIHETQYSHKIANVSYMYNYDGAPHFGYYWIDSNPKGTIRFMPEAPERTGYQFGGWYREPELIHLWDFNEDVTGDEISFNAQNIATYTGITLYAKWVSNPV